jgi:hypothetical protein
MKSDIGIVRTTADSAIGGWPLASEKVLRTGEGREPGSAAIKYLNELSSRSKNEIILSEVGPIDRNLQEFKSVWSVRESVSMTY